MAGVTRAWLLASTGQERRLLSLMPKPAKVCGAAQGGLGAHCPDLLKAC